MARTALLAVLRRNLAQALRRGEVGQAESLLRQLKDEDPLSAATRGLEIEVLMAAQRWPDAEVLAAQLVRMFPSSARIHSLMARIFYRQKHYAGALEHFTEAERLHPHWRLRLWLGKTYTQRGEYERAESLLVDVAREHAEAGRDLAWLYERRNEPERALRQLEAYLAARPNDSVARAQQLRLRASVAAPEELVREVEALEELGEDVAPELLPAYVQRLLETGRGMDARRFVDERVPVWPPQVAGRVAWVCHRLQAYDLALRLFLVALPVHAHDFKFLSALESAARRCQRTAEVATAYRGLAGEHRHLYGRIKTLERRGRA
jgi:tetratricopeptide (TPR) repeat protein